MKTTNRYEIPFLLAILIAFSTTVVFARQDADAIEKDKPDYLSSLKVEKEDTHYRISGTASDGGAVSKYMRHLNEKVGAPLLVNMRTENNIVSFVITVAADN